MQQSTVALQRPSPGRPFERLVGWMNGAGVVWVFGLTFLICADIAGRNLFDAPIRGVPELVSLSLVACVFLQIAFAVRQRRLTRAEVVVGRLEQRSPRIAADWHVFLAAVGAMLFLLMALGAWPDLLRAIRTREFAGAEGLFTVQVWPFKLLLVAGSLAAAAEFLRQLVVAMRPAAATGDGAAAAEPGRRLYGVEAARPEYGEEAVAAAGEARQWWLLALVPVVLVIAVAVLWFGDFQPRTVGIVMIATALGMIALGMPIAIALLLVGFLGLGLIRESFGTATRALALAAEGTISEYVFATVPLFVLMGLFVNVSDIGRDAFRAAQRVFGRIRGGLGVATVAANAMFAAITGISIASAAIFAKIAVPEMVRQGYTAKFAVGLTAGSSVLGMLIPPSLLLIIYGVIAEVSIGALFIAAVIPGILLAVAFALGVILMARFMPGFVGPAAGAEVQAQAAPTPGAPTDATQTHGTRAQIVPTEATRAVPTQAAGTQPAGVPATQGPEAREPESALSTALGLLPVLLLILLVLGGIYGGIFTPTEAGAAGAFAAMCLTLLKRRLSGPALWEVIRETGQVSVVILFLIIAASTFSQMLTLTELPQDLAGFMGGVGLGIAGFLAVYLLLLILLGTVLDATSTMLILLPLALPVALELNVNLIWFGIVTVIGVEIGLLTPPLGLSVYVIKSAVDDQRITLGTIFAGAFPFVLITFVVTVLLMMFPWLSLALL